MYRLEQEFNRQGLKLSRQTMANWLLKASEKWLRPIYDALHEYLGLTGKQKTSADQLFTLETVACLGACSLAPAMTVNDEVHAKMTPESAVALLEEIRRKEAQGNGEA